MSLLIDKYDSEKANLSNREINKIMKAQVKKMKSPDLSKLIKLEAPSIRATFYLKNKAKLKRKIQQLKASGIDYVIK